ncbi:helix-turn-helix domain-containing protein [Saccharopolyspora sp. K220]|uniref:IclR family transcriptional regulator domain-containing protein n=1 Tax=Saccharopolyspora soli TaxID=2926618 RepID=UPI001F588939|nr:IclR family transcriptional regulator C-terminal domain-containing protein [Saccharopolyspora soli]MCI2423771.1 helix-turn-helix domain-containing protein [Saccharopolyspora soli]
MPISREDPEFIQSIERALSVIRTFSADASALTLTDVARRTGLTRAGARRILLTLELLGYVSVKDGKFSLLPRILQLGYAYLASMPVWAVAEPHIKKLADAVNESSSLAVLDGPDITYLLRVQTKRIMRLAVAVGSRLPAYATATGRVLLAHLPEDELDRTLDMTEFRQLTPRTVTNPDQLRKILIRVREQGYAVVDQELEEGVCSIAVAVHDPRSESMASINISAHPARVSAKRLRTEFLPQLQAAAYEIQQELAAQAGVPPA